PLFEIARVIGEKSKDKNPFFDTLFNFKDFHVLQQITDTGEKIKTAGKPSFSIPRSEDTNTLFDFEVNITYGTVILCPKYNRSAVSEKTVHRCCEYFLNILNKYISAPEGSVGNEDILPLEERENMLYFFNDTAAPYSREKTMHQLFEEQVSRSPEAAALIDRDGSLQW
ncbi:MAG: hypothetical protein GY950_36135, partial [bacterium]|nr:hypothetical protein [bacterium]